MHSTCAIILCLMVQLGLFSRLATERECCPQVTLEHSHVDFHDQHNVPNHNHSHFTADQDAPNHENCPTDCSEHHHHDGTCIHSLQLSITTDNHCPLIPACSLAMGCGWSHMRVPDGPVFEMDKPPLIWTSRLDAPSCPDGAAFLPSILRVRVAGDRFNPLVFYRILSKQNGKPFHNHYV